MYMQYLATLEVRDYVQLLAKDGAEKFKVPKALDVSWFYLIVVLLDMLCRTPLKNTQ
jgi:hypothetical protein